MLSGSMTGPASAPWCRFCADRRVAVRRVGGPGGCRYACSAVKRAPAGRSVAFPGKYVAWETGQRGVSPTAASRPALRSAVKRAPAGRSMAVSCRFVRSASSATARRRAAHRQFKAFSTGWSVRGTTRPLVLLTPYIHIPLQIRVPERCPAALPGTMRYSPCRHA